MDNTIINRRLHDLQDLQIRAPSPRRRGTGLLNQSEHMISSSSRAAIKIDLKEKIEYDDTNVFKRMRLHSIDDGLVQKCAVDVLKTHKEHMDKLKKLIMSASGKSEEELKLDSKLARDEANKTGSHDRKTADEKQMYAPLAQIFTAIANFKLPGNRNQGPTRLFHSTNNMKLKADEPHMFGFPVLGPDFEITPCGIDISTSKLWRDRDAFGEVKPSSKQGPKANSPDTIPGIVSQCADYARLFMSGRPFMLYCTGLLIFGSQFCVGIFDRDGITFSPIHDMFTETEIFVRVVRAITHELTIQELGFDPTVRVLSDEETSQLTGAPKGGYPSAVISRIGNGSRHWCTVGPPMWTSVSLLGRGTAVWRVREYLIPSTNSRRTKLIGNVMIMKTSWRSSARNRESDIYQAIQQPIEGLAKFECGGDVYFADRNPITVRNLRSLSSRKDLGDIDSELKNPTPVLHRLVLGTVGKPLWQYKSELELLTGFRDALLGHKALYEQGILHRDISAGNVLLSTAQDEQFRGFITDLDFAHISHDILVIRVPAVDFSNSSGADGGESSIAMPVRTEVTRRGAVMTLSKGTAQFMARDLLMDEDIPHGVMHDVESFVWVFSYCVMRNLYDRASKSKDEVIRGQKNGFLDKYRAAFGQTTYDEIAERRNGECSTLEFPRRKNIANIVAAFMSKPLISLFLNLADIIHDGIGRRARNPINHEAVMEAVKKTILEIQ